MRFKIVAKHPTQLVPERKRYSGELRELRLLALDWLNDGYTPVKFYQWIEDTQTYWLIHTSTRED